MSESETTRNLSGIPAPQGAAAGADNHAADAGAEPSAVEPVENGVLKARIEDLMRTIYDPEIPVDIYELGMVYEIAVDDGDVNVDMTLTSPSCPVAGSLPGEVEAKVRSAAGVKSAKVNLVWDPPWTPDKMTEAAKLQLGMM